MMRTGGESDRHHVLQSATAVVTDGFLGISYSSVGMVTRPQAEQRNWGSIPGRGKSVFSSP